MLRNKRERGSTNRRLFIVLSIVSLCLLLLALVRMRNGNAHQSRTLVLYAYWEKNEKYINTLEFFLNVGVSEDSNIDYVFIIQDRVLSVDLPKYNNVHVILRDNMCFDFGAYGDAITQLGHDRIASYDYFIFINSSVRGPFLPKYWPTSVHWTSIFTSKLSDEVKLVGPSIVCLGERDVGGPGPHLEGYFLATDRVGLQIGIDNGVFNCFRTKLDVVLYGEYGYSKAILNAGYNLYTILMRYGSNIDWRDKKNWHCNKYKHPTRNGAYEGVSVTPLETIFHKLSWPSGNVQEDLFNKYTQWISHRKATAEREL